MIAIIVLSFQGPDGGLTFPMNGFSFHWFSELFKEQRVGDFRIVPAFHLYGTDCHDPYGGYLPIGGLAIVNPSDLQVLSSTLLSLALSCLRS